VRVDTGIAEGQEITPFYDPLVAKVIAHGRTREEARRRLLRGLDGTVLLGVPNNRGFLGSMLRHERFIAGGVTTEFIGANFSNPKRPIAGPVVVGLAGVLLYRNSAFTQSGWQSASPASPLLHLRWGEEQSVCKVVVSQNEFEVELPDDQSIRLVIVSDKDGCLRFCHDGVSMTAVYAFRDDALFLDIFDGSYEFIEFTPELAVAPADDGVDRLMAPMAGRIVAVCANTGETVIKGQVLLVLEAMKMEHEIKAIADGVIEDIAVATDDQVGPKQLLAVVTTLGSKQV